MDVKFQAKTRTRSRSGSFRDTEMSARPSSMNSSEVENMKAALIEGNFKVML